IEKKDESEEKLAVRPTSETIICDSFAKWIRSWRDLPLRSNQWCNIVRWETEATKLFLRSREFLWQEGHCVYETEADADVETELMLKEYVHLAEDLLAVPLIYGKKSEKERFKGAKYTMTIEAFMPDGKAVQAGTSHQLGQGFMKAFGVSFQDKDGNNQVPWHTSWGISTRLIGTCVMLHSDDKGLVLPPKVAPNKVVIIPIIFDESRDKVMKQCDKIKEILAEYDPILDDRDEHTPGFKYNYWELRGMPLRIEVGPKDIESKQAVLVRRDTGEKQFIKVADIKEATAEQLELMHKTLYEKAKEHLEESTVEVKTWEDFEKAIEERKLILTTHCGEAGCEEDIKEKTGASSRCIPLGSGKPKGARCVHCKKEAQYEIYFSKSY
ncbi:MAG: proline--tRNA ligase, partial [Candidatus Nanoarchaeia archaeon]